MSELTSNPLASLRECAKDEDWAPWQRTAVIAGADEVERLRAALRRIAAQEAPYGTMTIREASDLAQETLAGAAVETSEQRS